MQINFIKNNTANVDTIVTAFAERLSLKVEFRDDVFITYSDSICEIENKILLTSSFFDTRRELVIDLSNKDVYVNVTGLDVDEVVDFLISKIRDGVLFKYRTWMPIILLLPTGCTSDSLEIPYYNPDVIYHVTQYCCSYLLLDKYDYLISAYKFGEKLVPCIFTTNYDIEILPYADYKWWCDIINDYTGYRYLSYLLTNYINSSFDTISYQKACSEYVRFGKTAEDMTRYLEALGYDKFEMR